MRRFTPVNNLPQGLSWITAAILVLLPFHAFLTVWLSSLLGHYTLLRLWKEFLLVPLIIGSLVLLYKDRPFARRFFNLWIVKLILIYSLLLVICATVAYQSHTVSPKAMWYGLLVDLRFLIFFLVVLVIASKSNWLNYRAQKILLVPAILVAAFAILQYLVLPTDFLRHFGYSDTTISPYETINHNLHNLRVASTLRGANPLGAYLILPICALATSLFSLKRKRPDAAILFGGLTLALVFSFSRSAWVGAFVSVLIAAWFGLEPTKLKRVALYTLSGLVAAAGIAIIILHNSQTFQNIILHTDRTPTSVTSSNYGHKAAFKSAIKDVGHHPLGSGVGTAGPQSVYNDHPVRIAEDYYLQIGQEAGIIGMALFVAICVAAGQMLYARRAEPWALVLLSSLIGISLVGLLSHVWSDDTLAYIWWGLAAIALSPVIMINKHNQKNGQKAKTSQRRHPVR